MGASDGSTERVGEDMNFKSRESTKSGKVRNSSQLRSQVQMLQQWNAKYRAQLNAVTHIGDVDPSWNVSKEFRDGWNAARELMNELIGENE